jgi:hypothetical protein
VATKLVEIVNPNGRKGWVAETSAAAAAYTRPPSALDEPQQLVEAAPEGVEVPASNASTEAWRTYAVAAGMSQDEADQMSRDQLVAHYKSEED